MPGTVTGAADASDSRPHVVWTAFTSVRNRCEVIRARIVSRETPETSKSSPSPGRLGTALIADEFALLLDLQDVYWTRQGRLSVDVSIGILSVLGAYLTAVPFWHECARITRHHIASAAKQGLPVAT